jgi:excisionase family DNA binding protein
MMTEILTRDADKLHRALAQGGDEVRVTVSRETAEWMAEIVDAKVSGRDVVVTSDLGEVSPTDAGQLLGMSRPHVRKLMDDGQLDFRKVGTHHRITVASIQAFLAAERERRSPILAEMARLQNDAGLVE